MIGEENLHGLLEEHQIRIPEKGKS